MKEIPLTNGFVALVDDDDHERISAFKWFAKRSRNKVYAARSLYIGDKKHKTIWMHRFILGLEDTTLVCDHADLDGLNNQKSNLRICTTAQNRLNCKVRKDSRTGVKGVRARGNKFYASIRADGVIRKLGGFESIDDAKNAYKNAAKELHGNFARID